MRQPLKKPLAVCISDIHYNINTLALADASMRQAISKANELGVTLIVCGDLHDTKANMRGECVNAMIDTFKLCEKPPIVLVGNHCRINEKAPAHSLNFLAPYAMVVDEAKYIAPIGHFIPYQHDPKEFLYIVGGIKPSTLIICHQGVTGSSSGDYIQDKSAIETDSVMGRRIISGHYHARQTIALPFGGTWDYIGNPYTLNYAEANDPPKGFQILCADGSLEFVSTNLRKHVIWNEYVGQSSDQPSVSADDLLWIKMHGTKEQLQYIMKKNISLSMPFRLDLIPLETTTSASTAPNLSQGPLLDSLIDSLTNTSDDKKGRLKALWKELK